MNSIHVMGRLTKDPEITSAQNGTTIARYSVAVDRKFAKEGQQKTDFFPCVSFGKQAEFVDKYVMKGTKVVISGEMNLDLVQKDGKNVTYPKIIVGEIEFAESKKSDNSPSNDFLNVTSEEELPFA